MFFTCERRDNRNDNNNQSCTHTAAAATRILTSN